MGPWMVVTEVVSFPPHVYCCWWRTLLLLKGQCAAFVHIMVLASFPFAMSSCWPPSIVEKCVELAAQSIIRNYNFIGSKILPLPEQSTLVPVDFAIRKFKHWR